MRIDANAFFGPWHYWPIPHTSGGDVLRLMDRFGIEHVILTSLRGLFGDYRAANDETLRLAEENRERFTPVACISPMFGRTSEAIRALAARGVRGVRLYPLLHGYRLSDPFADEVCTASAAAGLVVIVPTRPMMNFRFATVPIDDVGALAARHPKTSFMLTGPNYLTEFRAAVQVMQRCSNVVIETSCVQGFRATQRLAEAVGIDRVLFGTGMPLHYPACNVAKLDSATLDAVKLEAIAAGNARRVFQLSIS